MFCQQPCVSQTFQILTLWHSQLGDEDSNIKFPILNHTRSTRYSTTKNYAHTSFWSKRVRYHKAFAGADPGFWQRGPNLGKGYISDLYTFALDTHMSPDCMGNKKQCRNTVNATPPPITIFVRRLVRPHSHRTRKQICCKPFDVACNLCCSVFHNLRARVARCSASCVNGAQGSRTLMVWHGREASVCWTLSRGGGFRGFRDVINDVMPTVICALLLVSLWAGKSKDSWLSSLWSEEERFPPSLGIRHQGASTQHFTLAISGDLFTPFACKFELFLSPSVCEP